MLNWGTEWPRCVWSHFWRCRCDEEEGARRKTNYSGMRERERKKNRKSMEWLWKTFGNRVGAVVRALAFHQCGLSWIPGLNVTCAHVGWEFWFSAMLLEVFLVWGGGGVEGGGGIVAVHTSGGSIDSTVLCRLDITSGWVCCSCTLLRKVFLQVLWFPPLMWNPTLICFAIISCDLIRFDLVFPISRALLSSSSSSS